MTITEWLGSGNNIGIDIWKKKYRHGNESFEEWLDRVSGGSNEIRRLIREKKFLFGGRILSNRGVDVQDCKTTYSNCYVLSAPEDNLESIFDTAKKLARTYSYGGGVGIDIGKLAPKGARVRNAAKESSGAVSFMDLYSLVTGLISQNGRRGALMISIPCDHPDVEEFVDIKKDLDRVTKANISIRFTNAFMEAARDHKPFTLRFKREETGEVIEKQINAAELIHKLALNNWDMGEPGMLFWSRITDWNLLSEYENFQYAGVNPCAEEPLPAGGSCCLGSINLSEYVVSPPGEPYFDYQMLACDVRTITRAMNDILDEGLPLHPLDEQRKSVADWRQIGIGVMGVADMLIKMKVRYGSEKSLEICDHIGHAIITNAVLASAELAGERGAFPMFDLRSTLASEFYKYNCAETAADDIVRKNGLRNSQLLTIAPCGTLSTMLGISGGVEPIFANYYERKTESLHGKDVYYKVYTSIVERYMKKHGLTDDKDLPEWFVTAQTLDYHDRIRMQAVWQNRIDASISSTVNLPESATVADVYNLYMEAWQKGLKGITVFRQNCRRSGILTTKPEKKQEDEPSTQAVVFDSITPVSRKTLGTTHGDTFCKKCACGTLYITVNRDDGGHIVESFVNTTKGGICKANITAVNRLISLSMRSGVKVDEIVDQIRSIDCPACTRVKEKGKPLDGMSCPDIIARTLEEFYHQSSAHKETRAEEQAQSSADTCPECGGKLRHEGGCKTCENCGWSKCG